MNSSNSKLPNGFGPKALRILRSASPEQGLAFKPETEAPRKAQN
jgi:hypothetical protein